MEKVIAKRAKKVVALIGITGLCFSLGGCSRLVKLAAESLREDVEVSESESYEIDFEEDTEEDDFEEEDTEEESSEAKKPMNSDTDLSSDIFSYSFTLDGEEYTIPMWFKDFEAKGWEFDGDRTTELKSNQYTFSQYWEKGDLRISTYIANLTPNNATFEESLVTSVSLDKGYNFEKDCVIELPGGIIVGEATKEDIIAAYGEPTDTIETEYSLVYSYEEDVYNNVKLTIDKETGWLSDVEIENMVELAGGNYEINEEAPDDVVNYQAPSKLGKSIYDKQFELDGVLYSVPCPIPYLLDHGFEIDEETLKMEIGSGQSGIVSIKYGDNSMVCSIKNTADYGTIVRNCWVQSFTFDRYDEMDSFNCSGGLYIGMSEAEFLKLVEDYNYEKSEDYDYYYIQESDDDDGEVVVSVDDGEVYSIEIKNRLY